MLSIRDFQKFIRLAVPGKKQQDFCSFLADVSRAVSRNELPAVCHRVAECLIEQVTRGAVPERLTYASGVLLVASLCAEAPCAVEKWLKKNAEFRKAVNKREDSEERNF